METQSQIELRAWLNSTRAVLAKYSIDEKAHLAITCGFDLADVVAVLPEWHMDILTRTVYRQREQYFVDRELKAVENFHGRPDLSIQWRELWRHVVKGKDFGDIE